MSMWSIITWPINKTNTYSTYEENSKKSRKYIFHKTDYHEFGELMWLDWINALKSFENSVHWLKFIRNIILKNC